MKDGTPETHTPHLPPCPFSVHCERLLESLDRNATSFQDDVSTFADSNQDGQLLMQLQAHLPGCPTCISVLSHARIRRFQQRQQIQRFLLESEQKVPSSAATIIRAIAREKRPEERSAKNGHKKILEEGEGFVSVSLSNGAMRQRRPARQSQKFVRNLLAFVAVLAIILASFNLFSRMLLVHQLPGSGMSSSPAITRVSNPIIHTPSWSSVIIALVKDGQKNITAIDPMTGKGVVLISSPYPENTIIDGVSHDGYQVLYHVFDGQMTRYYLQPSAQNEILYTVDGKGGPALWSTDDSAVFISTPDGIERVDVNAHNTTLVLSSFKAPDLRFYRDGFLYFAGGTAVDGLVGLNRMNLATGEVASLTAKYCKLSYDFWLSPSGLTVYYRCKTNPAALYAVGSDGTASRLVRKNAGRLIGYDAQGAPLTLVKVGATVQIVKLGVDAQHDQMVVADVAPGASDLAVDDVAVAPYGFSLLALAHYSNGVGKLWYDNLVLHKQMLIATLTDVQLVSSLQVSGWSRLQIPASSHFLGL